MEISTIIVGYCYDDSDENGDSCESCGVEGCPIKQNIWNIEILYNDLENVLAQVDLFSNDLHSSSTVSKFFNKMSVFACSKL